MRSIFFGIILLSASMADGPPAQAEKHGYIQVVIDHRQPIQTSRDEDIGAAQDHSEQDALTKRIERDNRRLDRLIEICPSCRSERASA
jgi:hypothetical protein